MSRRQSGEEAQGGPVGYQTDTRHNRAEHRERSACEIDQQRSDVQTQRSEDVFIRIQTKLKYCIRQHHEIRRCCYESKTEQNGWEFKDFIFPFKYMQVLGDMMNIPLCGMNPTYLTAMCFDSISAITVKYLFLLLTVTACYIPQTVSGFTSFFSSEHNRNISIFNIKNT